MKQIGTISHFLRILIPTFWFQIACTAFKKIQTMWCAGKLVTPRGRRPGTYGPLEMKRHFLNGGGSVETKNGLKLVTHRTISNLLIYCMNLWIMKIWPWTIWGFGAFEWCNFAHWGFVGDNIRATRQPHCNLVFQARNFRVAVQYSRQSPFDFAISKSIPEIGDLSTSYAKPNLNLPQTQRTNMNKHEKLCTEKLQLNFEPRTWTLNPIQIWSPICLKPARCCGQIGGVARNT